MNPESGKCIKIASTWDCVFCNLRCRDRMADFDVNMWKEVQDKIKNRGK